ncbi:helix-turn-helix domain-containing protein [Qipengyuania flava]|uniref:helix-turn-helix domain-containing protein n=1 Tax=Qipengyuania flava TaxID=192812 RepID=UPI001C627FCF|nr:helix-turn-helix domain-containing protein [Qipengyuania flava]QYJ07909.1 helix-turn-helix domain-containing protein [Qipengyuania flava]
MKRINPRRAKLHRSYSVTELAERLDVHKHTVRGWIGKGLPVIDGAKPVLILGSEFQAWWGKRRKAAKRRCQPGQLYCFKCREPKAPALGTVEYAATNAATGNLRALCETCGTMMHRRTRLADLSRLMPGLDVKRTRAAPSIVERTHPSPNTDNPAGA